MSGPEGHFLQGFIRNAGDGIAIEPILRLPELGEQRLGGIMKQGEAIDLKYRYDDKPCFRSKLADPMAIVEFEDRLGNAYRQEGPITQNLTSGGVIYSYAINSFGLPYKIAARSIGRPDREIFARTQEPGAAPARTHRTTTNQQITRLGFGDQASALKETHFGARSEPRQFTSTVDVFEEANDDDLARVVRRLPGCESFNVVAVQEGAILSDAPSFDARSFGTAVNAIHVKTGGEIWVRFGAIGGHQFYDLFRTLASVYVLAKYMCVRYGVYPQSRVNFAFNLIGSQYPDILPAPNYAGDFDMDVSGSTFAECATDAVLACLRAGPRPRQAREEVVSSLEDFWKREMSTLTF